ncbi:single-stranded DNA-binding protein [Microbacterium sp. 2P01SA-2]|uniref:single-stranded DNA-binding protein n=1 Tax=unclassified Microbacterium TaxID=2609290 RepID=UPI0039A23087
MSDRITVVGNIATEPEQRRTGSGIPVTSFRLASSQRYRDAQSGEWVDGTTNWYRISVFRALGENAFASLRKGQRIIVDGRLRLKEWEAGEKRGIEVEIDADAIGPDLKWGTASFQRSPRSDASGQNSPAPLSQPAPDGPSVADGEWSVAEPSLSGLSDPTPF